MTSPKLSYEEMQKRYYDMQIQVVQANNKTGNHAHCVAELRQIKYEYDENLSLLTTNNHRFRNENEILKDTVRMLQDEVRTLKNTVTLTGKAKLLLWLIVCKTIHWFKKETREVQNDI